MTAPGPSPVTFAVAVTATVDGAAYRRFLQDLLVTAVEGGVNYWASVLESDVGGDDPRAVLVDREPEEAVAPELILDLAALDRAVRAIVAGQEIRFLPERLRSRLVAALLGDLDAGEFDAGDADTVAQIAVLGYPVFG